VVWFSYTHPPAPTVILPARRRASRSACRRHLAPGFALRARTPRLAVGHCARPGQLGARLLGSLGAGHFSSSENEGHGGKASLWAGAGVEECQCPGGASRRIGATNRGAACVALPPLSSGDICRPPRPGERPQRSFSSMSRGHKRSYPTSHAGHAAAHNRAIPCKHALRSATGWDCWGFEGGACPPVSPVRWGRGGCLRRRIRSLVLGGCT